MGVPVAVEDPRADAVLARAVVRAQELLGIPSQALARVLGVSPASVSRLTRGRTIDPESKEGELALLFIRLYRSLDALVGGDEAKARSWLTSPNSHLGGKPVDRIERAEGLVHVVEYLDAMRGRT